MAVSNKQLAKAFKAAKTHLWNGKGTRNPDIDMVWICWALNQACKHKQITDAARYSAQKIISMAIGNCSFVSGWLVSVANVPASQLTNEALQTYRHEWLDHLIAEYSN